MTAPTDPPTPTEEEARSLVEQAHVALGRALDKHAPANVIARKVDNLTVAVRSAALEEAIRAVEGLTTLAEYPTGVEWKVEHWVRLADALSALRALRDRRP